MILTVTRVMAIALPRAPINGVFGAPSSRGILAIPMAPAILLGSFGFAIGHPVLKILLFERRIHILRDA